MPTILTGTPLGPREVGRQRAEQQHPGEHGDHQRGRRSPDAISAGTVSGLITKIEPNRTVNDAPVVDVCRVPR